MLTVLLDSPVALAAAIVILTLLNYALGARARHEYSRQTIVESDAYVPPRPPGKARSDQPVLMRPSLLAIVAVSLTLSADRGGREIFGGGYLVVLIASFVQSITGFQVAWGLTNPAAAEGHVRYSAMYGFYTSSVQAASFALFCGIVGVFFGSPAFVAGSLFLVAIAIGYWWRARQASRKTV